MTVGTSPRRVGLAKLGFVLACLVIAGSTSAAKASEARDLAEARAGFQKTDTRLNATYRALRAKLRPSAREALAQSEKAWVRFRDLECEYHLKVAPVGDLAAKLRFECTQNMTYDRIQQLEGQLSCPGVEGQVDCPRP